MPIVYLLRHAQSTANSKGILAGRDNKIGLSKKGFKQAKSLVQVLDHLKIQKIYSSPLTRCIQTIDPYLQKRPETLFQIDDRLVEMDYGSWSGKKLSSLSRKPQWQQVQSKPSTFVFPSGESFRAMRSRIESVLKQLKDEKNPVLLVTHGDIIKMILAVAVGLKSDDFQRFIVEPGSISTISISKSNIYLVSSNSLLSARLSSKVSNALGGGDLMTSRFKWWRR
jgi:probable phosphoglycerate mutase